MTISPDTKNMIAIVLLIVGLVGGLELMYKWASEPNRPDYSNAEVMERPVLRCMNPDGTSKEWRGVLAHHRPDELPTHWFVLRKAVGDKTPQAFVVRIPEGGKCFAI